ncbi:unnamed protein product [Allacma fusca]|uniref:Uncharacterized protein n=1 Tax=Allacma fusca TaxID=39272 RepID=A0A8J2JDJ4_9HEXA|nr:unnamed protein product [Allacma fusca]
MSCREEVRIEKSHHQHLPEVCMERPLTGLIRKHVKPNPIPHEDARIKKSQLFHLHALIAPVNQMTNSALKPKVLGYIYPPMYSKRFVRW